MSMPQLAGQTGRATGPDHTYSAQAKYLTLSRNPKLTETQSLTMPHARVIGHNGAHFRTMPNSDKPNLWQCPMQCQVGGQTDSEGGNQTAITRSLPSSDKHSKHWDLIHSLHLLLFVMHTSGLHPTLSIPSCSHSYPPTPPWRNRLIKKEPFAQNLHRYICHICDIMQLHLLLLVMHTSGLHPTLSIPSCSHSYPPSSCPDYQTFYIHIHVSATLVEIHKQKNNQTAETHFTFLSSVPATPQYHKSKNAISMMFHYRQYWPGTGQTPSRFWNPWFLSCYWSFLSLQFYIIKITTILLLIVHHSGAWASHNLNGTNLHHQHHYQYRHNFYLWWFPKNQNHNVFNVCMYVCTYIIKIMTTSVLIISCHSTTRGLDSDRSHNGLPASKPINPTIDFISISF